MAKKPQMIIRNSSEKIGLFELTEQNLEQIFHLASEIFEEPFEIEIEIKKKTGEEIVEIGYEDFYEFLGKIGTQNVESLEIDIRNSYHPEFKDKFELHKRIWIKIVIEKKSRISLVIEGKNIKDSLSQEIINRFFESLDLKESNNSGARESKSESYNFKNFIEISIEKVEELRVFFDKYENLEHKFFIKLNSGVEKEAKNTKELKQYFKQDLSEIRIEFNQYSDTTIVCHIDIPLNSKKCRCWISVKVHENAATVYEEIKEKVISVLDQNNEITEKNEFFLVSLLNFFSFKYKVFFFIVSAQILSIFLIEPASLFIKKLALIILIGSIDASLIKFIINQLLLKDELIQINRIFKSKKTEITSPIKNKLTNLQETFIYILLGVLVIFGLALIIMVISGQSFSTSLDLLLKFK